MTQVTQWLQAIHEGEVDHIDGALEQFDYKILTAQAHLWPFD